MEEQVKLADFRNYVGDVNLECGGAFYDLSELRHLYVDFLAVTDLDSAAGVDGCVLVERGTIYLDNKHTNAQARECCDLTSFAKIDPQFRALVLADAIRCYNGGGDPILVLFEPQPWDGGEIPPEDAKDWGRAKVVTLPEDVDVFEYLYTNGHLADFE